MGNRAVIKPVDKNIGVYLHWNGGRDSVEAFLTYCKLRGFRDFGGKNADGYGISRFMQVVGNFFGGGLSIGLETNVEVSDKYAEWLDNGIYEIDGWEIVGRYPKDITEQHAYDLLEMLCSIDEQQPENDRLGKGYIYGTPVPVTQLKRGDKVWVYDENAYHEPKCVLRTVAGIEKEEGWNKGKPYFKRRSVFSPKGQPYKVHLQEQEYRLDTMTAKERSA